MVVCVCVASCSIFFSFSVNRKTCHANLSFVLVSLFNPEALPLRSVSHLLFSICLEYSPAHLLINQVIVLCAIVTFFELLPVLCVFVTERTSLSDGSLERHTLGHAIQCYSHNVAERTGFKAALVDSSYARNSTWLLSPRCTMMLF